MRMIVNSFFVVREIFKKQDRASGVNHEGRDERVRIEGFHVILTNFYNENAYFSTRVRGQRFQRKFFWRN